MAGRESDPPDKPSADQSEGFLGRWSRRKAGARSTPEAAAGEDSAKPAFADPPAVDGNGDGEAVDAETGAPPAFDVEGLPDIDSLGPNSDFSVFMQAGVPPALKSRALRRLWRVKPELANLDGLIDYGEDLTGSFKVTGHLKTAYEVGRGFLRDRTEPADKSVRSDGSEGEPTEDEAMPDRPETPEPQEASTDPESDDSSRTGEKAPSEAENGGKRTG